MTRIGSLQGILGVLRYSSTHYVCSKTAGGIGYIVRTWLFHWPVSYNDWPIIVVFEMFLVVGGVLLRYTLLR